MNMRYYLVANAMTSDPDDQSARVSPNQIFDITDTVQEILRRNSTLTEADVLAVLNIFFEVICFEVGQGNSFNLPIMHIAPGISGVFKNVSATFDASLHTKKVNISAAGALVKAIEDATVEKIIRPAATPILLLFTDRATGSTSSITPGSIARLDGDDMKFNPTNPDEGLYIISSSGVEVKVTTFDTIESKKLIFGTPATLPKDTYYMEVRKGYGSTTIVIRTGRLEQPLTVS